MMECLLERKKEKNSHCPTMEINGGVAASYRILSHGGIGGVFPNLLSTS